MSKPKRYGENTREAPLFGGSLLLSCAAACSPSASCTYAFAWWFPIRTPSPLGDSRCVEEPLQKAGACGAEAAALLSPVLSASGMESGGARYGTERKRSQRTLTSAQTWDGLWWCWARAGVGHHHLGGSWSRAGSEHAPCSHEQRWACGRALLGRSSRGAA